MAVVDEFVEEFLKESFEHLERFELDLSTYRSTEAGDEDLQRMFRAIHTVKGVCGFLGFARLETVTTAGEALMGGVRDGERNLDADVLDVLTELAVVIRGILERIGTTAEEPAGDDRDLIERMSCVQMSAG